MIKEKTEKAIETEILPSKVVVKQVRRNTWLPMNHDGSFRFTRSFERLVPQFLINNGVYNTGLTPEDEIRFEKKIGLVTGTLNKSNVEYWAFKLFINIPKEGVICDGIFYYQKLAGWIDMVRLHTDDCKCVCATHTQRMFRQSDYPKAKVVTRIELEQLMETHRQMIRNRQDETDISIL